MMHEHPDYEDLIAELTAQLTGFRSSNEPPNELARRIAGLTETFWKKAYKGKKL